MKNKPLAFLFLCSALLSLQGVFASGSLDSVLYNINKQVSLFPQEKLYLHTDKPYYITGETVFFRAHVLDAHSHIPSSVSRYVYVELINPLDSVVLRVKVKAAEGVYSGHLSLSEDLPQGNYSLRAYTNFMRNVGEAYFFTKTLRIGDPLSVAIKTEIDFEQVDTKRVQMNLRFADMKRGEYLFPIVVKFCLNGGKMQELKSDNQGFIRHKFTLPTNQSKRVVYVELEDRRNFKQYLHVPYPDTEYDVSFHPEGGQVVANTLSTIAFKAVKANGMPEEVSGEVFDQQGELLAEFNSFDQGMGSVILNMPMGASYYAVCKNAQGVEKRFFLPQAVDNAAAIKVLTVKDKVWVSVNRPEPAVNPIYYLLIHARGDIQYAAQWDNNKEYLIFNKNNFPAGIIHVMLFSPSFEVISERLFFNSEEQPVELWLQTNKESYRAREKVLAEIGLRALPHLSKGGSFSVAVTDDREVSVDTCRNILEHLLLSSELKGHIPCPAHYLVGDKKSNLALDLLMLTQAWRRYSIAKAAKGEFTPLKEVLEIGQEISGTVKGGLLFKPLHLAKVSVFSPATKYFNVTETDENGRYYLRGFELPDSTSFVVHATNKKGKTRVELLIDKETYPEVTIPRIVGEYKDDRIFEEYITKADLKYTYENGMRLINLDEVVVKGRHSQDIEEGAQEHRIYGQPDNTLSEKEIEESGFLSLRELLPRFPGVEAGPEYIRIRGAKYDPILVVDNVIMEIEMIDDLNLNDIARVDVLKSGPNLAMFGSRGANGVISVFTKTGKVSFKDNLLNVQVYKPLGYQQSVEFYSPRYDTPEAKANQNPDLRSTLYWNPSVSTEAATGKGSFDFYTADADKTTYTVVVEGVSNDGQIVRYTGSIKRE